MLPEWAMIELAKVTFRGIDKDSTVRIIWICDKKRSTQVERRGQGAKGPHICSDCIASAFGNERISAVDFTAVIHYQFEKILSETLVSITYGATKSKVPQSVFILLDKPVRLLEHFVDCPKSARMTLALAPFLLSSTLSVFRSR